MSGDSHVVLQDSININESIGQRKTLSLTVISRDGSYKPLVGMSVIVNDPDDGDQFGGTVDSLRSILTRSTEDTNVIQSDLTCVSWEQLLDKRHTGVRTYSKTDFAHAGDIVQDLIDNTMGSDGLIVDISDYGPVIDSLQFDFATVREAMDQIVSLASTNTDKFMWDITPAKIIRFYKQNTFITPFALGDDDGNTFGQITVSGTREKYINRIYIRLGKFIVDAEVETFHGEGSPPDKRAFTLTRNVAEEPTITLDGVAQTVGIADLDTGKDWYWQLDSDQIVMDDLETPIGSSSDLVVTYRGYDTKTILLQNDDAVSERAGVEGGTGYYESFISSSTPTTSAQASALGQSQLDNFGGIPEIIEGSTMIKGLHAGMLFPIAISRLGLGYWLVNTSTNEANRVLGPEFAPALVGKLVLIGGSVYSVRAFISTDTITLEESAGDQESVEMRRTYLLESVVLKQQGGTFQWAFKAVAGALLGDWRQTIADLGGSGGTVILTSSTAGDTSGAISYD